MSHSKSFLFLLLFAAIAGPGCAAYNGAHVYYNSTWRDRGSAGKVLLIVSGSPPRVGEPLDDTVKPHTAAVNKAAIERSTICPAPA